MSHEAANSYGYRVCMIMCIIKFDAFCTHYKIADFFLPVANLSDVYFKLI